MFGLPTPKAGSERANAPKYPREDQDAIAAYKFGFPPRV